MLNEGNPGSKDIVKYYRYYFVFLLQIIIFNHVECTIYIRYLFHFGCLPFSSSSILALSRLGWVLRPLSRSLTDGLFAVYLTTKESESV